MNFLFPPAFRTSWLLWLVLISMAVINVLLLQQNIQLRTQIKKSQPPPSLQIGEQVAGFSGANLKGELVKIDYSENSKKRLFFYFTPSCKFCREQFPYWKDLIKQTKTDGFEIFGLVSEKDKPDEIESYLRSFDCGSNSNTPLPVLFTSDEVLKKYKLTGTPTTLLISPLGLAEQVWVGRWNDSERETAFSLIN